MNITFNRQPNKSLMVIDNVPNALEYAERMISENSIKCVLKYSKMVNTQCCSYQYDISEKKSIKGYFLQEGITYDSVFSFFDGLLRAINEIEKYLISPNDIYLSEETVFVSRITDRCDVSLAIVPGLNSEFVNGLLNISTFLIQNVDNDNEDAVKICYTIYEKCSNNEVGLNELLECINKQKEKSRGEYLNDKNEYEKNNIYESVHSIEFMQKAIDSIDVNDSSDSGILSILKEEKVEKRRQRKEKKNSRNRNKKRIGIFKFAKKDSEKNEKESFFYSENLDDLIIESPELDMVTYEPATTLLVDNDSLYRRLIYLGNKSYSDIEINHSPFKIGSKDNNDYILKEDVISRAHARITIKEDEYFVEDLESKNGTFVNGEILGINETRKLCKGDRISFANITYRFG